jgi:hypothetical protein
MASFLLKLIRLIKATYTRALPKSITPPPEPANMSPSAIDADAGERRVTISLPDMFKGFLVDEPVLNRFLDVVGAESEDWLQRCLLLRVLARCSTFAGLSLPDAKMKPLC